MSILSVSWTHIYTQEQERRRREEERIREQERIRQEQERLKQVKYSRLKMKKMQESCCKIGNSKNNSSKYIFVFLCRLKICRYFKYLIQFFFTLKAVASLRYLFQLIFFVNIPEDLINDSDCPNYSIFWQPQNSPFLNREGKKGAGCTFHKVIMLVFYH